MSEVRSAFEAVLAEIGNIEQDIELKRAELKFANKKLSLLAARNPALAEDFGLSEIAVKRGPGRPKKIDA
jgi:hypothetical protein